MYRSYTNEWENIFPIWFYKLIWKLNLLLCPKWSLKSPKQLALHLRWKSSNELPIFYFFFSMVILSFPWIFLQNWKFCNYLKKKKLRIFACKPYILQSNIRHIFFSIWWELGITFVSSVLPSPLAPKSSTLKVVEWPAGGFDGNSSFGLGDGSGGDFRLGVGSGGAFRLGVGSGGAFGLGVGSGEALWGGDFGFDPPLWWLLLLPRLFPFFLYKEAEVPLLCLQCLPLLALQVSKFDDQSRKAMKSMNVRLLKLKPLIMFNTNACVCVCLWEREREREREREILEIAKMSDGCV